MGIDLYITPGETETVVVSASEEKYRDKITTTVENGILKISYDWKSNIRISWNGGNKRLKAFVSFKTLEKLNGSGGSDVYVRNGVIKQNSLSMSFSGGSDFKGAIDVQSLDLDVSGGSDAKVSGRAAKASIDASGGSDVDGYELAIDECTAHASGGSDINVTVNKKLTAHASGGSDIYYKGECDLTKSASGGSDVKKRSR